MMRLILFCCLLFIALPLLAASDIAAGTGFLDHPRTNGGIALPKARQVQMVPPAYRAKELKGPVRSVSESTTEKGHRSLTGVCEYDRQGRLILSASYDRSKVMEKRMVFFGPHGDRTQVTFDYNGKRIESYDANGRLIYSASYIQQGGKFALSEESTQRYDGKGREIAWCTRTRSNGNWLSQGVTLRFDDAGHIVREESADGEKINLREFSYNSQGQLLSSRTTINGRLRSEGNWTRDAAGTSVRLVEHDADGNLADILLYRYNAVNLLLERVKYAWNAEVVKADGSLEVRKVPLEDRTGDPPLIAKTIYSYDDKGRVAKTAYLDGQSNPGYAQLPLPHAGWCCFGGSSIGYSYLEYTYDAKSTPHWTAYDAASKVMRHPDFANPPGIRPPTFPLTYTVKVDSVLFTKPHIIYDRYGNWIQRRYKGSIDRRKITYY